MEITIKLKNDDNVEPAITKTEFFITIGNKGDIDIQTIENVLRKYIPGLFPKEQEIDFTGSMPTEYRGEYKTLGLIITPETILSSDEKEKWELEVKKT